MNMAKTKTKSKIDFKQILLAKGEYIALGVAGLFLALLLFSGVSKLSSARDPEKISKDLKNSADQVNQKIKTGQITGEDEKLIVPPNWIIKPIEYKTADVRDFPLTGPLFDPIAKPDTKKENPVVLDFDPKGWQADLIRISFKAYDITRDNDGNVSIAVIVDKPFGKMDSEEMKKYIKNLKKQSGQTKPHPDQNPGPPPAPPGGGPGPGGPGGGFGSGGGPPGGRPGQPGARMGSGFGGQSFDANVKRPAIKYVPIDELDKNIEEGKLPAFTVIPLRAALIHMEIPYKKQVEEIKRALRLPTFAEAMQWGPIYDGYEVQRRVTQVFEDGKSDVISDWAEYKFEEQYQDKVNSRKVADTFEEGYLSYFIRYDMQLALPLPQLVKELGGYPKIRLPNIQNAINKLIEAGVKKIPPSETSKRLNNHNLPKDLYRPQDGSESSTLYGENNVSGVGTPKMPNKTDGPTGPGKGPTSYNPGMMMDPGANAATQMEVEKVENLLLRFIDVNIEPGYTYEYRIRVRMLNPNFGRTSEVSNPADAKVERLYSRWFPIDSKNSNITIPPEQFVYAADVGTYRKTIEETYQGSKETDLRERLQVKDSQAVVEICRWLPSVTLESGTLREPVGAWVVADIPCGRGEYVGRKTFVKLPLWSSETKSYILREITSTAGNKGALNRYHLPKGWLVNFVTPDILVDFHGGRIQTRLAAKNVVEDVETELLIVSPDGKLTVKKSRNDEKDEGRKQILGGWTKWIAEVEKRKEEAKKDDGGFAPKPGGMP
jgi:hypothetical protein